MYTDASRLKNTTSWLCMTTGKILHKKTETLNFNVSGSSEADDGSQHTCFYLLYIPFSVVFTLATLHSISYFCTLYKFLVSFQYHREPRQIADLVGQRSRFTTPPTFCPVGPPDRLSCRWVMIPFMVLHHIYPSSFSAHLRASCSTSLVHVVWNLLTPT